MAAACHLFAPIDVAAGKHPPAVARLDGAAHEHDVVALVADDRADGDLRIEIEHEAAARADEARRLARLQQPSAPAAPPHIGQNL